MTTHVAMPVQETARSRCADVALIAIWAAAVALGWWQTVQYEFDTPDQNKAHYVRTWPSDSSLKHPAGRPTLLVFLHPKCPCTRATLNELDRLAAIWDSTDVAHPEVQLVATVPADAEETWWNTDVIAHCKQIAGSNLYVDRSGLEATNFGVVTSGTVLLFDASGNRRFGGGITVSRGHEGHSAGADSLLEVMAGRHVECDEIPVFGCRLCLPKMENHNSEPVRNGFRDASAHLAM